MAESKTCSLSPAVGPTAGEEKKEKRKGRGREEKGGSDRSPTGRKTEQFFDSAIV